MADEEIAGQPDGLEEDAYDGKAESSKPWLKMIADAEKVFRNYQDKSDNIDKLYADLDRLSNIVRDRQFQIFWANLQVLGPSVYSRAPVPVVVPRFKDRKALPRAASELLERCTIVSFDQEDIDLVMRGVRDGLIRLSRGAAWIRYEAAKKGEYLTERNCFDTVHRRDFLHDPARTWKEVDWVAKKSHLTKKKMRARFSKTSGKAYQDAAYEKRKDEQDADDGKLKAAVWELWCKSLNKVVWVTEGVDVCLDAGEPHLTLEGFFPCPRPAYGTLQPDTLIPVPDMLFYKDQLEEINELTARLASLTDAVKVRGFYPAGAGEIGDAIESAVKAKSNNQLLVPISNWSMVGQGGVKDMIVWLPLDMIIATIKELVELRKQLIDDVYQITGLSDIMRGSTDSSETLGAQELKSQYGSTRIRDKQSELVRFARDITRIDAEIMAENFQPKTLMEMSQLDIPTDADIAQQVQGLMQQAQQIQAQAKAAMSSPEVMQQAQANPEQAQQMMQQAQQQLGELQAQIKKLQDQPTVEKVIGFLRDQRLRPFVLDIETDSTIAPDENATKQRATEFITAVGGFLGQAVPLVQMVPESAPLAAETLKYVASQFRAGRSLEGAIEEFADKMKALAGQPKPPNPEQMKAQADAQNAQASATKAQADAQKLQQDTQNEAQDKELERRVKEQEAFDASKARDAEIADKSRVVDLDISQKQQKHAQDMDIGVLQLEKLRLEIEGVQVKTQAAVATTQAKIEQTNTQTDATVQTTDAKIEQSNTQTDNSIASTQAGIAATERGTEIKAEQAEHGAKIAERGAAIKERQASKADA